jgi:hypothetical protein
MAGVEARTGQQGGPMEGSFSRGPSPSEQEVVFPPRRVTVWLQPTPLSPRYVPIERPAWTQRTRDMRQSQQPVLKSQTQITWITKFYGPFILIIFCVVMLSGKFVSRRLLVVCPITLVAVFFLSLASLEVKGGVLRYRRFWQWMTIDEKTVVASSELWAGVIGYIRISRYIPPWKRVYFVLDERPGLNPFARRDSPLLEYLKKLTHQEHPNPSGVAPDARPLSNPALLMVGFAATIFGSLMHVFLPPFPQSSVPELSPNSNLPTLIVMNVQRVMFCLLQSFPLTLALCAIFLLLTIYRRRHPYAWTYALVAGLTFAGILFHFL